MTEIERIQAEIQQAKRELHTLQRGTGRYQRQWEKIVRLQKLLVAEAQKDLIPS